LGSSNWDVTEAGDRPLNMPLWGAMGAPVSMGLGLALAQPTKRVLVITGDGDMLMSLGALTTVATQQPDNLAIVVLDNEKFGETGNQATHTSPRNNGPTESGAGADLSLIAKGCGIADVGIVREAGEVPQLVKDARTRKGPVFRVVRSGLPRGNARYRRGRRRALRRRDADERPHRDGRGGAQGPRRKAFSGRLHRGLGAARGQCRRQPAAWPELGLAGGVRRDRR